MANANRTKTTKTITVECTGVDLHLDDDEAYFLLAVLSQISGDPKNTRRGLSDRMWKALRDAGFKEWDSSDLDGIINVTKVKQS